MASSEKRNRKLKSSRARKRRLAQRGKCELAFQTLEPRQLLAVIMVGNTTDLSNAPDTSSITALMGNDGGDGISLREAIAAANISTGEDTITFDTSVFTAGDNSVIRLTQGELLISDSLSIDGTSVGSVVITGDANDDDVTVGGSHITDVSASFGGTPGALDDLLDDNSRVLRVSGTGNVALAGLIITGGRTTNSFGRGGGILSFSNGALTLNDSTLSGNSTTGVYSGGGGIYTSSGDVTLVNSTLSDNSTNGGFSGGGGIRAFSGAVSLVNSTLSGNSTSGDSSDGGGIGNYSGDVSLVNSTLSGNSTTGGFSDGGGIWTFRSKVLFVNSTMKDNSTLEVGGGISFAVLSNGTERLTLHNSIVAGNMDKGRAPDVQAIGNVMTNLVVENSLIGDTTGAGITTTTGNGNILNEDSLLGPLANNGGSTLTHALLAGSPAIDAGNDMLAFGANGAALGTDQRGGASTRVFDDPAASGMGVDIGAFELHTVLVDNRIDENDGIITEGNLSLREAIGLVEADATLDTITFDASVFTGGDNSVIRLAQGELVITDSLSIDATSVGNVVITGDANGDDVTIGGSHITDVSVSFGGTLGALDDLLDDNSRVLNVSGSGNLALTGLTITGGRTESLIEGGGGGILFFSIGTLTLNDSTLSGNSTTGFNSSGGGVRTDSGDVTLVNSTLSGNSATGDFSPGGGVFTLSGDVSLFNSTLSGNSTIGSDSGGGGIRNYSGDVTLFNSTLSGNSTMGFNSRGGGVRNYSGAVSLVNSTLSGNKTTGYTSGGGGINTSSGAVSLVSSTLSGNSTTGDFSNGGGISTSSGAVSLVSSTLSGNSTTGNSTGLNTTGGGGGIRTVSGSVSLLNSTLSGNSTAGADIDGGGIWTKDGTVLLTGSTVTGNSASGAGGGIRFRESVFNDFSGLRLRNSIVAGNTDNGTAPDVEAVGDVTNDLIVENSLIGDTAGSGITTTTGPGNILNQAVLLGPLADNGGPTLTHALLAGSPAINAGNDLLAVDANGAALRTDQRGENRISGTVDIGSFEAQVEPGSLVVTTDSDTVDATDFRTSLREAINFANNTVGLNTITFDATQFTGGDNSVIRLVQGELFITDSLSIDGTSVGGVLITGDANDDDVTVGDSHITDVLASFGGTAGALDDLLDDNSRVLNFLRTDLTLTGLTITGGRTTGLREGGGGIRFHSVGTLTLNDSTLSGNSSYGDGGGIYAYSADVSLFNSTLSGNRTTGKFGGGGGIYTGLSNVSLFNSTLSGNSASDRGGGISTTYFGNVTLVNSTLSGNWTTGDNNAGGGISTFTGNVTLVNSTLSSNSTTGDNSAGGGISTSSGAVSLVNSTLSDNRATGDFSDGGGIGTRYGDVSLVNSTVTGNSTFGVGGGISFDTSNNGTERLTLHNSIVAGNTDNGTAPDVEAVADVTNDLTVEYSLIGNTTGSGIDATTGTGNILNEDPLLGELANNGGPTLTHALLPGSPAIDAGSNALALDDNGNPLTTDQRGEIRIQSGTVDIGAVESESEGPFLLGDADLNGGVDFADIPAFIDVLISGNFLNEADVDRSGVVDFADIPAFIDVLINVGSSALTFQSVVVAPPISSAASLVSVSESESFAPVASTVEVPLTSETSDAIAESVELAELVEYDSLEPVEAADPTEIVAPPRNVLIATESTSIEASQLSTAAGLPPVVAPQFNPSTNNLPLAPVVASAEDYQLPERKAIGSSTPLSLVGGLAGYESPDKNRQFLANDSESDEQETGEVDLLDETFASYADDLDVVFS